MKLAFIAATLTACVGALSSTTSLAAQYARRQGRRAGFNLRNPNRQRKNAHPNRRGISANDLAKLLKRIQEHTEKLEQFNRMLKTVNQYAVEN